MTVATLGRTSVFTELFKKKHLVKCMRFSILKRVLYFAGTICTYKYVKHGNTKTSQNRPDASWTKYPYDKFNL
jgi:hypothetical protein